MNAPINRSGRGFRALTERARATLRRVAQSRNWKAIATKYREIFLIAAIALQVVAEAMKVREHRESRAVATLIILGLLLKHIWQELARKSNEPGDESSRPRE